MSECEICARDECNCKGVDSPQSQKSNDTSVLNVGRPAEDSSKDDSHYQALSDNAKEAICMGEEGFIREVKEDTSKDFYYGDTYEKPKDVCECGYPRHMHNRPIADGITNESPIPCEKFKPKAEDEHQLEDVIECTKMEIEEKKMR